MLESTEPRRDSWMTRRRELLRAYKATTSSVTLPKLALSSPPTVGLVCTAICSVTKPSRSARGQRPTREKTKVTEAPQWLHFESTAKGMNTNSTFTHVDRRTA